MVGWKSFPDRRKRNVRSDDVLEMLLAQPFIPFRIHLTDGMHYDVRHPELVKVERSKATVFFHRNENPLDLVLRKEAVALLHINRLEPLEAPTPPATQANGEGAA